MKRVAATMLGLLVGVPLAAGSAQEPQMKREMGSKEAKISNALAAAPAELAQNAGVMDWDQTVLKTGTNGYTCLPDFPDTPGNDPMCLDDVWVAWAHAYLNKTTPPNIGLGVGYMLTADNPASNKDPYATGPTPDNEWIEGGPHIMLLVPDPAALENLPTDPALGTPWVMWKGTPYVHIMVPMGKKQETRH